MQLQLSRVTTAVALVTALAVPALSAPAHAATVTTTYTVSGFNPVTRPGAIGDTVSVTNTSGSVAFFQASWELTPRSANHNGTVNFSPITTDVGTVTAVGTGIGSPVFVIT